MLNVLFHVLIMVIMIVMLLILLLLMVIAILFMFAETFLFRLLLNLVKRSFMLPMKFFIET